ncbi:hypothetical protein PIB30_066117 [Stylosanthes scabra]|uniref:Uncharacterized protein n=1 Tax=Stylosanthes scabra TaxID=79078 RepID=A0ABU6VLT9_9FABA|nr:hypothetical protein [Stylosanthes scabra]
MDPKGENQEVDSTDELEEVSKYIPGEGLEENQNLGEEELEEEGLGADHEMDPNQEPEEPEADPEEDQEEDPEMEEEIEEPEVMELDEDERVSALQLPICTEDRAIFKCGEGA